jgi:hypothetical protein
MRWIVTWSLCPARRRHLVSDAEFFDNIVAELVHQVTLGKTSARAAKVVTVAVIEGLRSKGWDDLETKFGHIPWVAEAFAACGETRS